MQHEEIGGLERRAGRTPDQRIVVVHVENPLADRVPKQNVYVTLTNQRLIVHSASTLGKPKDLVAEFGHDEIASMHVIKKKLDPGEFVVIYADDSITNLDMQTRQGPEEMVAAWESVAR